MKQLFTLYRFVQIVLMTVISLALTGCQLWEMASYRWHNSGAEPVWKEAIQEEEGRRYGLPFMLVNNHIMVQVSVNGSEPLQFVLDSGAAASVILETDATDLLNLSKENPMTISGAGDEGDPVAYVVHDTRIDAGNLYIQKMSIIFAPTAAMPFDSRDETYFDGVLGADFFNCCIVEINYDTGKLYFQPHNESTLAQYTNEKWQRLAMEVSGNTPYLTTTIYNKAGKKSVKVMLDSGSTGVLTLFAGDGKVPLPAKTYSAQSSGISGDSDNLVGYLHKLEMGEYKFSEIPIYFRMSGSNPQSGSHGVMGNGILKRFNQVYDFKGKAFFIQTNRGYKSPIHADRSGLRVLPHQQGAIVKNIAPGTGAEALGIPLNAIVTHIQGERIVRQNFDRLVGALRSKLLAEVELCWINSTDKMCRVLSLADRL